MVFAGFTSIIAKMGLAGIFGALGHTIRTLFVSLFVLGFGEGTSSLNSIVLVSNLVRVRTVIPAWIAGIQSTRM
jgi:bacterial/archaeal transporter family protein